MIGKESCLGTDGSLEGKSEDSILGVLPADVEGRISEEASDIFLTPAELDGRDCDKKSGFGRSKKKDFILLRLLLLLCVETLSLLSRSLESGI